MLSNQSMPHLYPSMATLQASLTGILMVQGDDVIVQHGGRLKSELITPLLYNALFNPARDIQQQCHYLIHACAHYMGVHATSLHEIYQARQQGAYLSKTIPRLSLPGITFDLARALLQTLKSLNAGLCLVELTCPTLSSLAQLQQSPAEFSSCLHAAAIIEGYHGALFLQLGGRLSELVPDLFQQALQYGFYNFSLDTTHLIETDDFFKSSTSPQVYQRSIEQLAQATAWLRNTTSAGITCAIGAHMAAQDDEDKTVAALRLYLDGFMEAFRRLRGSGESGLSKMVLQQSATPATLHLLESLRDHLINHHQMGGVSWQTDSALSRSDLAACVQAQLLEVDLTATALHPWLASPHFPTTLHEAMTAYIKDAYHARRSAYTSDAEFIESHRLLALPRFKADYWKLPEATKTQLQQALQQQLRPLLQLLGVAETATFIRDQIHSKPQTIRHHQLK